MLGVILRKAKLGQLAHNTALNTLWQFARIALQALWLVAIARLLGSSEYGKFAGLAGLAATLGGIVGLGTGYLLLQNVSRDRTTFDSNWRRALQVTLATGVLLCAAFSIIAAISVGRTTDLLTILIIGLSELICVPLLYVGSFTFQACERLGWAGFIVALMAAARLLAIVIFWWFGMGGLETYVWFHLCASILSVATMFVLVKVLLKPVHAQFQFPAAEVRDGTKYAMAWSTSSATTDLDKTLVLHLAGSDATGHYSVAYRLANILTLPVASLVLAAQPRLFRNVGSVAEGRLSLLSALLFASLTLGVIASLLLWALSFAIPEVLGPEYAMASSIAQTLSFFPPLYCAHLLGSSILMTSSRQMTRIAAETTGALVMGILAFRYVPQYGVHGMAMIVVVTEALVVLIIWSFIVANRNSPKTLAHGI